MINTCNKIIVQTFKILSRINNIHFEARKGVHRKLSNFNENDTKLPLYGNVSTKGKNKFILTLNVSCEQPSFILEWDECY